MLVGVLFLAFRPRTAEANFNFNPCQHLPWLPQCSSPSPSSSPVVSPSPSATPEESPTASPSATPEVTATPSATPSSTPTEKICTGERMVLHNGNCVSAESDKPEYKPLFPGESEKLGPMK